MGQVSKEMMNMLTEFLICEIGSKALDGITYTLITKDDKDKEKYNHYKAIRDEVTRCGYGTDEIFRVYEVSNGYIFDMDLSIAKKITAKLAIAVQKTNGVNVGNGDLIGDSPEKRRKADMIGLAKYVKHEWDEGNQMTTLALFSKNSVPYIVISAKTPKGEFISERFNAYAVRHWDIETVNARLLIPEGIRISKIEPCEILPSKTGVKFNIYIERC